LFDTQTGKRFAERSRKRRKIKQFFYTIICLLFGLVAVFIILILGNNNVQNAHIQTNNNTRFTEKLEKNDSDLIRNTEQIKGNSATMHESNRSTNESHHIESNGTNAQDGKGTQQVESEDSNVLEVIRNEWNPIGTAQEKPHVTTFDTSSLDWREMERAIRYATKIAEGDMITWRIENGGATNKVKATVTTKDQTSIYRVYLEWVENEGWKPTLLKKLKENDKKTAD
jgi:hypothetical protein